MFHPKDKEMLEVMLGTELGADLLNEYMVTRRLRELGGLHGPLGATGLIPIVRQVGLEPRTDNISVKVTNWRDIELGTMIRCIEDGRVGEYVGQIGPSGMAIKFEKGIEEIPKRLLELASQVPAPDLKTEVMVDDEDGVQESLKTPDWKGLKKGASLYAKFDDGMKDATLKSRTPAPDSCTLIIDEEEMVLPRSQVFLPV